MTEIIFFPTACPDSVAAVQKIIYSVNYTCTKQGTQVEKSLGWKSLGGGGQNGKKTYVGYFLDAHIECS